MQNAQQPADYAVRQLEISLGTLDGKHALYIDQPNELTLVVLNRTADVITLKGGAPQPEAQLPADGPTSFYVSFGGLLTSLELSSIGGANAKWNPPTAFLGAFQNVALVPKTDVPLPAAGRMAVAMTNVTVPPAATVAQVTVEYVNVPGVAPDAPIFALSIQKAPVTGAKDVQFGPSIEGLVLITYDDQHPHANTLTVTLQNDGQSAIPVADSVVFNIRFLYADPPGYIALTTKDLSRNINLTARRIVAEMSDAWDSQYDDQNGRAWTLRPAGLNVKRPNLLEPGEAIELTVDSIVTKLAPGPTIVAIQRSGIPGYNDGYLPLNVEKQAAVQINSFSASPAILDPSTPSQTVTLTWQAVNADTLHIEGWGDVTGQCASIPEVTGHRRFVLTAYGVGGPVSLPAEVHPFDYFLCQQPFQLQDSSFMVINGTLTETLVFADGGSGSYAYVIDGTMSDGDGKLLPVHDALGPVAMTWSRAGSVITIARADGQTTTLTIADGRSLVYTTPFVVPFVRSEYNTRYNPT